MWFLAAYFTIALIIFVAGSVKPLARCFKDRQSKLVNEYTFEIFMTLGFAILWLPLLIAGGLKRVL